MATREENSKEINYELEKLSDEQLDQVAGGIYDKHQLADDSRFLNVLLRGTENQPERNNWFMVTPREVIDAWQSVGIEIKEGTLFGGHSYSLNGQTISQSQAWEHAEKVVGKHLSESDWNW